VEVTVAHPLTVAGVFAHPDDETWSLAGVFAPGPDDPPEISLVEAFAAEGRPGG
jgi:hypothetical protein